MSRLPEFDLEFSSESCPCGCCGEAALHEAFESGLSGEAWRQRRPSRPGPGGPGSGPRPPARRPGPRHRPGPFRPGIVPLYEPYAPGPGPEAGTEHARWVRDCLNRIFGLQLPVDGILDAAARSALRRLQQQEGLPATGIVSPATERALQRRCREKGTPVEGEWLGERRELPPVAAPPRSLPSPCGNPTPLPCAQTTIIDHFAEAGTVVGSTYQAGYDSTIRGLATCIAAALQSFVAYGVIRIIGHASTEGSLDSNRALGQARAGQVTADLERALLSQGLAVSTLYVAPIDGVVILKAESAGETRPRVSPERTENDRKQNRRVEIDLSGLRRKPPGPAPAPAEIDTLIAKVKQTLGSLPLGQTGIVLPTAARFLDPAEQAEARTVYGNSLDFTKIVITDGLGYGSKPATPTSPARPVYFTVAVQLSSGWYVALNMGSHRCWARRPQSAGLIHELAHAWQSQHHGSEPRAFMWNSVKVQARAIADSKRTGKLFHAYAYIPGKSFGQYSSEQIAQQVQHGYEARGSPTPTIQTTIRAAAPNAPVAANVASLRVVVVHELGAPGVIRP